MPSRRLVEDQRCDHDAAQAVDLRAAGAERHALLAAGDHHGFAGAPDPVDQRGAVPGELVDVVAVPVAAEVRHELAEVGVDEEQVRPLGAEDADRLVERDAGQLARVEHGGGDQADLLQRGEPPPVQVIAARARVVDDERLAAVPAATR